MSITETKQLIRKAHNLWNVDYVPPEINRRNRHKWVQSVIRLGDKWLLAKPVEKQQSL